MIKEEILFKKSKTGTTAFYFVPDVTPEQVSQLEEPAYVVFNNYNQPIFYATYSGKEIWRLENVNDYTINVQLSALTSNYVTGYSVSQVFNQTIPESQREIITQRFNDNVTSALSAQTQIPLNQTTYVFFTEHEVDDMFANIKLSRSYESLDTLGIYNKPINSIPSQEARTGVLFGKLEAIQTLKDEVGNNIRIPLRNVPIGIFNPSDEFPSPVALDNNGDRFFMNLKESSTPDQYFDLTAYTEDQKFLKSASQFLTVPEKFKFTTITNDNGEFVIYDVPVGSQTVVFEVDLFKQGLTKDEIILNNFPFPTNDDSNIGEFPCYYFNQVPTDIVSAWGTNQTGYTELNIQVNLDLRKWATYIFPPGAYGNEKLEVTVAKNVTNTLKIQVRDMTSKKFAPKVLEIVQVPNDLDRRSGANYLWFNEILDQRQQLEFFKFGCHVLKLPANLYDPNGFRTDSDGIPTVQKGTWIAAYQFNVFVNKDRCSRTTGGYQDFASGDFWSHFDVNFFPGANSSDASTPGSGLGRFPYEKPWTISYPEQYKIPKKPVEKRFDYGIERTVQGPFLIEEPAYEDGDLIGNIVFAPDEVAGGFGVQNFNGVWFPNQIAYVATKDYMYKYEKGVRWNETYANGYEPLWDQNNPGPYYQYPQIAGVSSVNNGEKYQRVECGYGYFMKYHDWPRIYREEWAGDIYFYPGSPQKPSTTAAANYGAFKALSPWTNNVYNLDDQNYAFAFDQFRNFKINKESIDIYRIVKSGIDNIKIPENFVIPTFMRFSCDQTPRCQSTFGSPAWRLVHQGQFPVEVKFVFNVGNGSPVLYSKDGVSAPVIYANGTPVDLLPGGFFFSFDNGTIQFTVLNLPGNSSYDPLINKNTVANYQFEASLINRDGAPQGYFAAPFGFPATTTNYPQGFVASIGSGSAHGVIHNGLSDDFTYGSSSYQWHSGSGTENHENADSIVVTPANYNNQYQGGYL